MLRLSSQLFNEMITHARYEDPNECCGLLAGKDDCAIKLFPVVNSEQSPYRYNMDSQGLFRAYREIEDNGWEIVALYHSHTQTEAYPSPTDVRLVTWPDTLYIIISLMDPECPLIKGFYIVGGVVQEQQLSVDPAT